MSCYGEGDLSPTGGTWEAVQNVPLKGKETRILSARSHRSWMKIAPGGINFLALVTYPV